MAKSRVDNSNSVNQIEGLLNLLVDLEIVNGNQRDSAPVKQKRNGINGSAVAIGGSTQVAVESDGHPEAAPERISSERDSTSDVVIDRLQSLLLEDKSESDREPPPPNQDLEKRLQSVLLEEGAPPPLTAPTGSRLTPKKKASRGRLQRLLIEADKNEELTSAPSDSKPSVKASVREGWQSLLQESERQESERVRPIASRLEEEPDKIAQAQDSDSDRSNKEGKEPSAGVPFEPLGRQQQEAANSPEPEPALEWEASMETPLRGQLVESYSSETAEPIPWGEVKLEDRESDPQTGGRRRLQRMLLQLEKLEKEKTAALKRQSRQLDDRLPDWEIPPKPAPAKPDEKELAAALGRLQQELVDPELASLREIIALLEQKVAHLEGQIYQPTDLIDPLLPLIAELLESKADESKEDMFDEMVPIIDRVIWERSQQDRKAMSRALASLIPGAISQHISESPDDIANALGPTMGRAIKEQIRLEQDAMVDALYPVIGNTISKYMGEVVTSINDRVENALSVKGVTRKLRAKMQGVSEAELIFQESMPFTVKAIFLIHKGSGLVIAEAQKKGNEEMESDMIAGMLTAIRSFANDCMTQSGSVSELNEIEYDNFKLILEVAGYCYVALVTRGQAPKQFIERMRKTMSTIVQYYGEPIESFEGDTDTIPEPVGELLTALMETPAELGEDRKRKPPIALLAMGAAVVLGIGLFWVGEASDRRLEKQVISAWNSTPELAVYPTEVDANRGKLTLAGKVPNQRLRQKAFLIAAEAAPNREFENKIVAVQVPPDPVKVAQEVKRITAVLNQRPGVAIAATYIGNRVTVEGTVPEPTDAGRITAAFAQIPGVGSVTNALKIEQLILATRIYFGPGSSRLTPGSHQTELLQIQQFLSQYPETDLSIIGHTDISGSLEANLKVARERASAVKQALVELGIAPERLQVTSTGTPPPDMGSTQPLWMSRCVRFQPIVAP